MRLRLIYGFGCLWVAWILILISVIFAYIQSQAHPGEIMMEVLKTLQDFDINWKTLGPYCVRYDFFWNHIQYLYHNCLILPSFIINLFAIWFCSFWSHHDYYVLSCFVQKYPRDACVLMIVLMNNCWLPRCRWVSHFSVPMAHKSCGSSASTNLSESPMSVESLPTSDASPQANSCNAANDGLEEHFLVKFQLQVLKFRRSCVAIFLGAGRLCIYFFVSLGSETR